MKWIRIMGLLALGLLAISCAGQQPVQPTQLPAASPSARATSPKTAVVMVGPQHRVSQTPCRQRCVETVDNCMTVCTSGAQEEACAQAAMRCMDRCGL